MGITRISIHVITLVLTIFKPGWYSCFVKTQFWHFKIEPQLNGECRIGTPICRYLIPTSFVLFSHSFRKSTVQHFLPVLLYKMSLQADVSTHKSWLCKSVRLLLSLEASLHKILIFSKWQFTHRNWRQGSTKFQSNKINVKTSWGK